MIAQAPQPDRASYYARAQLFSAKGDYARAIADYDKLLSIMPGDKIAQQQRQAAIAMQAELAKVHGSQTPAASPPKQAFVVPDPLAGPAWAPLIVQAKQLMDQRKYADAIARLNQALAADPHIEIALRLRSAALMLSGRFAESRADMDEVLKQKPDDSAMLATRAIASIALRQPDKAAADVERALALNPSNEMAYLGRGMLDRAAGKYQDAVADLDRAIALNPKDSAAYSERGLAYISLNRLDKALVDFDQSIALNPSNGVARGARGLALLMKGANAEGLVDIKEALDRDPNNQLAQVGQGLAMLVSGQYDRAIVALDRLIGKAGAFDTSARLLRARAYLSKKDPAAAMTDLDLVLGARPNEPEALQLRGIAFLALHDNDKALDDLSRAIAQRETVEGYFARAKVHEAQNDVGKATSDYQRATELNATSVFDRLAQAESKQKVQQLSKKIPCGNSARAAGEGTCL